MAASSAPPPAAAAAAEAVGQQLGIGEDVAGVFADSFLGGEGGDPLSGTAAALSGALMGGGGGAAGGRVAGGAAGGEGFEHLSAEDAAAAAAAAAFGGGGAAGAGGSSAPRRRKSAFGVLPMSSSLTAAAASVDVFAGVAGVGATTSASLSAAAAAAKQQQALQQHHQQQMHLMQQDRLYYRLSELTLQGILGGNQRIFAFIVQYMGRKEIASLRVCSRGMNALLRPFAQGSGGPGAAAMSLVAAGGGAAGAGGVLGGGTASMSPDGSGSVVGGSGSSPGTGLVRRRLSLSSSASLGSSSVVHDTLSRVELRGGDLRSFVQEVLPSLALSEAERREVRVPPRLAQYRRLTELAAIVAAAKPDEKTTVRSQRRVASLERHMNDVAAAAAGDLSSPPSVLPDSSSSSSSSSGGGGVDGSGDGSGEGSAAGAEEGKGLTDGKRAGGSGKGAAGATPGDASAVPVATPGPDDGANLPISSRHTERIARMLQTRLAAQRPLPRVLVRASAAAAAAAATTASESPDEQALRCDGADGGAGDGGVESKAGDAGSSAASDEEGTPSVSGTENLETAQVLVAAPTIGNGISPFLSWDLMDPGADVSPETLDELRKDVLELQLEFASDIEQCMALEKQLEEVHEIQSYMQVLSGQKDVWGTGIAAMQSAEEEQEQEEQRAEKAAFEHTVTGGSGGSGAGGQERTDGAAAGTGAAEEAPLSAEQLLGALNEFLALSQELAHANEDEKRVMEELDKARKQYNQQNPTDASAALAASDDEDDDDEEDNHEGDPDEDGGGGGANAERKEFKTGSGKGGTKPPQRLFSAEAKEEYAQLVSQMHVLPLRHESLRKQVQSAQRTLQSLDDHGARLELHIKGMSKQGEFLDGFRSRIVESTEGFLDTALRDVHPLPPSEYGTSSILTSLADPTMDMATVAKVDAPEPSAARARRMSAPDVSDEQLTARDEARKRAEEEHEEEERVLREMWKEAQLTTVEAGDALRLFATRVRDVYRRTFFDHKSKEITLSVVQDALNTIRNASMDVCETAAPEGEEEMGRTNSGTGGSTGRDSTGKGAGKQVRRLTSQSSRTGQRANPVTTSMLKYRSHPSVQQYASQLSEKMKHTSVDLSTRLARLCDIAVKHCMSRYVAVASNGQVDANSHEVLAKLRQRNASLRSLVHRTRESQWSMSSDFTKRLQRMEGMVANQNLVTLQRNQEAYKRGQAHLRKSAVAHQALYDVLHSHYDQLQHGSGAGVGGAAAPSASLAASIAADAQGGQRAQQSQRDNLERLTRTSPRAAAAAAPYLEGSGYDPMDGYGEFAEFGGGSGVDGGFGSMDGRGGNKNVKRLSLPGGLGGAGAPARIMDDSEFGVAADGGGGRREDDDYTYFGQVLEGPPSEVVDELHGEFVRMAQRHKQGRTVTYDEDSVPPTTKRGIGRRAAGQGRFPSSRPLVPGSASQARRSRPRMQGHPQQRQQHPQQTVARGGSPEQDPAPVAPPAPLHVSPGQGRAKRIQAEPRSARSDRSQQEDAAGGELAATPGSAPELVHGGTWNRPSSSARRSTGGRSGRPRPAVLAAARRRSNRQITSATAQPSVGPAHRDEDSQGQSDAASVASSASDSTYSVRRLFGESAAANLGLSSEAVGASDEASVGDTLDVSSVMHRQMKSLNRHQRRAQRAGVTREAADGTINISAWSDPSIGKNSVRGMETTPERSAPTPTVSQMLDEDESVVDSQMQSVTAALRR